MSKIGGVAMAIGWDFKFDARRIAVSKASFGTRAVMTGLPCGVVVRICEERGVEIAINGCRISAIGRVQPLPLGVGG